VIVATPIARTRVGAPDGPEVSARLARGTKRVLKADWIIGITSAPIARVVA